MVTPATLTALSITTTTNNNNNNNSSSNINSNKHKNEENIISAISRKSTQSWISSPQHSTNEIDNNSIRSIPTFRIPKLARSNNSLSSPDNSESSSSSLQVSNMKNNLSPVHQSNDEFNSQQGKRKFSLSQYKEHKRLKSNDITQNCSADIDMRINTMENIKNSPPTSMDDDSSSLSNNQPVVSPKMNDISKDVVIKSNLSEPGVKKLIKKKVVWADEKNQALVQASFFEVDDSEVTDMHAFARQCATNISIAQIEKLLERDLRKRQGLPDINSFDDDGRQNLPPLPTLIRILLPDTISIPLVKSQERVLQEEREKTVLQALLMRSFLPDSPGEPDGDLLGNSTTIERNEPKLIPFDDDTSSVSNQISSVNNNSSTSVNVSLPSTNSTPTITPSLSSLSLDNISPEVAQILAQAKGNLTSATTNNPSSTIVNPQINPSTSLPTINPTLTSVSNLTTTSNLLSALLNATRQNGIETTQGLPTNSIVNSVPNLPLNFNVPPPPTHFGISQLLVNALSLGLTPTTFNNPMFPPSSPMLPTINSNNNSPMNSSTVRFVSPPSQQSSRFNQNNNNEYPNTNFRGNNRGRIYRRGLHNNNNNNRRDYYQNRNHNNRNIFS